MSIKFLILGQKFFGDFPGSSLAVELNSNPGDPQKFPRLPRKFPGLPRKFPGLPRRSALSLGSLTPSPDSQKLSLTHQGGHAITRIQEAVFEGLLLWGFQRQDDRSMGSEKGFSEAVSWTVLTGAGATRVKERKKHPKKSKHKDFFCPPPSPPFKVLCVCIFLHFKEKTQPEHKEFRKLKSPNAQNPLPQTWLDIKHIRFCPECLF